MRLIDADELHDALLLYYYHSTLGSGISCALSYIKNAPTIDTKQIIGGMKNEENLNGEHDP